MKLAFVSAWLVIACFALLCDTEVAATAVASDKGESNADYVPDTASGSKGEQKEEGVFTLGSPDEIMMLSATNFSEAVKTCNMVFVSFYAPWCGYCRSMLPELVQLAADLPNMNIDGRVAMLDASAEEHAALSNSEGVDGYPSLVLYRHGKRHSTYLGARTRLDILDFLKKRMGPPATPIARISELEEFVELLRADADADLQTVMIKNRQQHGQGAVFNGGATDAAAAEAGAAAAADGSSGSSGSGSAATDSQGNAIAGSVSEKFNYVDNHVAVAVALFLPSSSSADGGTGSSEGGTAGIHGRACAAYVALASAYDQAVFLYSDSAELLERFGLHEDSLLVFVDRSADGVEAMEPAAVMPLSEDLSEEDIITTLVSSSLPLVIPYTVQSQPFINTIPIKKHVLVFHDSSDRSDALFDVIESVASDMRGTLVFISIPHSEHQLLQFFGIDAATGLPEIVLADMADESSMRRYNYNDYWHSDVTAKDGKDGAHLRLSESSVRSFLDRYLTGNLLRSLFSETTDVADTANKAAKVGANEGKDKDKEGNGVQVVVGSQMDSHILARVLNKEDVFLYIHAPWCAHCKSFEPVVKMLAEHYGNSKSNSNSNSNSNNPTKQQSSKTDDRPIHFLKIDGSRNEIDHDAIQVRGYPAIYIFKAGDTENPVEYDGDRQIAHMRDFIDGLRQNENEGDRKEL